MSESKEATGLDVKLSSAQGFRVGATLCAVCKQIFPAREISLPVFLGGLGSFEIPSVLRTSRAMLVMDRG